MKIKEFSQLTIENIGSYVYCLINPDDNKVFYIGKGKGNRVFSHANGVIIENKVTEKINLIKNIIEKNKEVKHVVIRYGLTDKEAKEVESALIDFIGIDKLSNIVKGNNSVRGLVASDELELRYNAVPAEIIHNVMMVKLNQSYKKDISDEALYKATRGNWKASMISVSEVEYVFSLAFGIIREVYEPFAWHKNEDGRLYFDGRVANEDIRNFYINKSVEEKSQNSIRYIFNNNKDIESFSEEAKSLRAKEIRLSGDMHSVLIFTPQCCGCANRIVDSSGSNCKVYGIASVELYEGLQICGSKLELSFEDI